MSSIVSIESFPHSPSDWNLYDNYVIIPKTSEPLTFIKNNNDFNDKFYKTYPFINERIFNTKVNEMVENNVIIAGGSVLKTMVKGANHQTDLDMYIIGDKFVGENNKQVCLDRAFLLLETIRSNLTVMKDFDEFKETILFTSNDYHWDVQFTIGDEKYKIQIMKNPYPNKEALMKSFDLDCCCLMYDGKEVTMTTEALTCLKNGILKLDFKNYYYNYESRVAKYIKRYNFNIAFPNITHKELLEMEIDTSNHLPKIYGRVLLVGKFVLELSKSEFVLRRILNGNPQLVSNCEYYRNKNYIQTPCKFCESYIDVKKHCVKLINPESPGYEISRNCIWDEKEKLNYTNYKNEIINPTFYYYGSLNETINPFLWVLRVKLNYYAIYKKRLESNEEHESDFKVVYKNRQLLVENIDNKKIFNITTKQSNPNIIKQSNEGIYFMIKSMVDSDINNKISNHPCNFKPKEYYYWYKPEIINPVQTNETKNSILYINDEIINNICDLFIDAKNNTEIEKIYKIFLAITQNSFTNELIASLNKFNVDKSKINNIIDVIKNNNK